MNTRIGIAILPFGMMLQAIVGCDTSQAPKADAHAKVKVDQPDTGTAITTQSSSHAHTHDRGTMLITDVGEYHALLTAHLSRDGNELDVFFETSVDKSPEAVALPLLSFEGQATAGDGESHVLTFEPAPAEERPKGEAEGACSHFVAKAAWMKADDKLRVVARFNLDGKELKATWNEFEPKRYAHHHDE
jgi:hypothetical protein